MDECCGQEAEKKGSSGRMRMDNGGGAMGFYYVLTVIGAMIYFMKHAVSFWGGVVGFFKGFIWPLFATMKVLELLKL